MRWRVQWRRPRYQAVIVGELSGRVTPLPQVTFSRLEQAVEWCDHLNDSLDAWCNVHFNIEPIQPDSKRPAP